MEADEQQGMDNVQGLQVETGPHWISSSISNGGVPNKRQALTGETFVIILGFFGSNRDYDFQYHLGLDSASDQIRRRFQIGSLFISERYR
jgi:hypothetical protein